jgi:hypothetical protein
MSLLWWPLHSKRKMSDITSVYFEYIRCNFHSHLSCTVHEKLTFPLSKPLQISFLHFRQQRKCPYLDDTNVSCHINTVHENKDIPADCNQTLSLILSVVTEISVKALSFDALVAVLVQIQALWIFELNKFCNYSHVYREIYSKISESPKFIISSTCFGLNKCLYFFVYWVYYTA